MELNKQITSSYILNKLKDTGNASSTLISDEFNKEKEYLNGEYCIKNNTLYKFTADKSAGEWDESKAEPTSIGSVLSEQNTNMSELNSNLEYIMENLGTLSSEEYKCNGTVQLGILHANSSITRDVYFSKTYLEPPAVTASASSTTSQVQGKLSVTITNITNSSCKITVKNTLGSGDYAAQSVSFSWAATGYVKKVS